MKNQLNKWIKKEKKHLKIIIERRIVIMLKIKTQIHYNITGEELSKIILQLCDNYKKDNKEYVTLIDVIRISNFTEYANLADYSVKADYLIIYNESISGGYL
jgi:uncharacterized protein YeeX (DUF496 family)